MPIHSSAITVSRARSINTALTRSRRKDIDRSRSAYPATAATRATRPSGFSVQDPRGRPSTTCLPRPIKLSSTSSSDRATHPCS